MSWNYEYAEKNHVKEIEYVKTMYDSQVAKIKQEEYIRDLLFAGYVEKVKANISRYDYLGNLFNNASNQIDKKKKKEREELNTLEMFIREDFFNNNSDFKIIEMLRCGYDSYAWNINIEYNGNIMAIQIPVLDNINVKNIEFANDGMFSFMVKVSDSCWSTKVKSYKIKDIAEYIKNYYDLDNNGEEQ